MPAQTQYPIAELLDAVRRAGDAIMEIYRAGFEVRRKADASPVTEADLAAHGLLAEALQGLMPSIPLVSEEAPLPPYSERRRWHRFWLIDPLDGTKEFIARNGEFTVNIALIEDGQPRLGLVGVPAQGRIYLGEVAARRAELHEHGAARRIRARAMQEGRPITLIASRSHGGRRLQRYLETLAAVFPETRQLALGSSLKLCALAEGGADLYPRLGPTCEWDIAAGHAVLAAAGGALWPADGAAALAYNKPDLANPEFIAAADGGFPWRDKLPPLPSG